MGKKNLIIVADYSGKSFLTLEELCESCGIAVDQVEELIYYDIIHVKKTLPHEWIFDLQQLKRVKKALRMQQDLEINLAGIAVVLDLLDEIDKLRTRTEFLETMFFKR